MTHLTFTQTHEWLQPNASHSEASIGISHHAQHLLGDVVFIDLPEIGQTFAKGDEIGVIESVKAASDLYAPVSGTVIAVNEELTTTPALVNTHPETRGWLIKIKVQDAEEITTLMDADAYQAFLNEDH
ncbi:MAG TPA: glycine cleavage system protein GcvH [Legionellales bacterium]|nr:glycine cleavage system protein GcvH [Legionellales bacterium]HCA89018.1 glycine cleavage system protein GcvH [Legionellales bacterium]|tara:strand:- start:2517 stop:2900 length:384 start_codon:yes stop_codon:yes gene_type:complete